MTDHPHLPALSSTLSELVDGVLGWIIEKVEAGEGFSVLMISRHADGTRASHYHADSVEQGVDLALAALDGDLAEVVAYAMAFDARARDAEGERCIFLCRVEEAGMPRAHELALLYELHEDDGKPRVAPARHLHPTGRTYPAALACAGRASP
jgi:hypothetical protein